MITTGILTVVVVSLLALIVTFKAETWDGILIRRSDCPLYEQPDPHDDKTDPFYCLHTSDDEYRLLVQTSFSLEPYVGQRVRVTGHRRWGVLVVEKIEAIGVSTWEAAAGAASRHALTLRNTTSDNVNAGPLQD